MKKKKIYSDRRESTKNIKVKDCSNCIYNKNNRKCEVMRKLLWNEECFAWADAEEALKKEEAVLEYSIHDDVKCRENIKKYKRKVLAYG